MGCLNSSSVFTHWFGNIHLSGICNRKCYFCIGQHMMDVDALNTLNTWPLPGIDNFVDECIKHGVREINLTGTNTDPLLYTKMWDLKKYLHYRMPHPYYCELGIRTNGIACLVDYVAQIYDKASLTVCSLDAKINTQMMGGDPPDIYKWKSWFPNDLKVNIVLGPENVKNGDIFGTIVALASFGIKRINLREPYGQPHIGNPIHLTPEGYLYGMPYWWFGETKVCYWDVHYCEVQSINLYANGRVSTEYPITKGYTENGEVWDQNHFPGGRVQEQWL